MQRNACRDASMQMACVAVLFVSLWKDLVGEGILRAASEDACFVNRSKGRRRVRDVRKSDKQSSRE